MARQILPLSGLLLLAVFAGCRTSSIVSRRTDSALPRQSLSTPANPTIPADSSGGTKTIELLSATAEASDVRVADDALRPSHMTLIDSINVALADNPDLIAQRQADPASVAALGNAQTYPFNPYLQVQVTPYEVAPDHLPRTIYHYVLLMQTIQLAGQQQFREDAACATVNSVRWNIHQAELLNVSQTARLFYTALYQRGLRDLAKASAENNDELLRVLERQLEAGQSTAADVEIVRIDARSTRQQLELAEANYLTALRDWRRQLNLPPTAPVEPAGDLLAVRWHEASPETLFATPDCQLAIASSVNRESFAAGLAGGRPDVMALRSDCDVARAAFNLATASRVPDLQIGPYYQETADGILFLGFRAHMDLPVINNGVPLQRQRHAELNQKVTTWQQLHRRASLEAEAALERYDVALDIVRRTEQWNRDNLPDAFRRLEEQFQAGEVEVVRMVQARTSLIQNRRAYLDSLNEVAQSAANLTAAAGIAPDALLDRTSAPTLEPLLPPAPEPATDEG